MSTNSQNRKNGAALSLLNIFIRLGVALIYMPFMMRFFGQSEYGIYTLANSIIGFLSILDLGFGNSLVRYASRSRAKGESDSDLHGMFLSFYSIISAAALLIGLFLMFNIENFFDTNFTSAETHTLRIVFTILLVNTVLTFPFTVFSSIIRSYEHFTIINGMNILKTLAMHGLNFALIYMGFRSVAVAASALFFSVLVGIINIIYVFGRLKVKITFKRFPKSFYKELFGFSFFILLNIIIDRLYAGTDNVILGKVAGTAAVAVYGAGVSFEQYFAEFSTSISSVYLPHISALSTQKDGIKKMSDTFLNVSHTQFIILSLILLGFTVFGREFISLWLGDKYKESYVIALIIMIPNLIPLTQNVGIAVLQALNKHKIRSVMYMGIALLNVGISIPLAMKLQGVGAAIGTCIGMILGQILFMNWYYYKRIGLDIPKYWKQSGLILLKLIPVAILFIISSYLIGKIPVEQWSGGKTVLWLRLAAKIFIPLIAVLPYYYMCILNNNEKKMIRGVGVKLHIGRK